MDCASCAQTVRCGGKVVRNKERDRRKWVPLSGKAAVLGLHAEGKACQVCGEPSMARALCSVHYIRLATKGSLQNACRWCDKPHDGAGMCSAQCRDASHRAAKTKQNVSRRASTNAGDRIDPISVFERDNWRCHLCRRSTPKRLRGTCDPRAPELDHVVTLADGGQHTWSNVACACRQCNGRKGAKSLGQLVFALAV